MSVVEQVVKVEPPPNHTYMRNVGELAEMLE